MMNVIDYNECNSCVDKYCKNVTIEEATMFLFAMFFDTHQEMEAAPPVASFEVISSILFSFWVRNFFCSRWPGVIESGNSELTQNW